MDLGLIGMDLGPLNRAFSILCKAQRFMPCSPRGFACCTRRRLLQEKGFIYICTHIGSLLAERERKEKQRNKEREETSLQRNKGFR